MCLIKLIIYLFIYLFTSTFFIGVPTTSHVWEMINEPGIFNKNEDRMFDYLRRFIHSLSPEELASFLCFVMGFSVCSSKKITIQFNSVEGFQRRPTASTCGMVLHLPVSYQSYLIHANSF